MLGLLMGKNRAAGMVVGEMMSHNQGSPVNLEQAFESCGVALLSAIDGRDPKALAQALLCLVELAELKNEKEG